MRFVIPVLALSLAAGPALAQAPAAPTAPASPAPTATPAAPMATPAAPAATSGQSEGPRTAFERRFVSANTTKDGHLTKQQAQAAHLTTTVRHFAAIDKDNKGYITLDDLRTYEASQRAQRSSTKPSGSSTKPPG
jgi:hypothetical protein